jgi:hypothetical protein
MEASSTFSLSRLAPRTLRQKLNDVTIPQVVGSVLIVLVMGLSVILTMLFRKLQSRTTNLSQENQRLDQELGEAWQTALDAIDLVVEWTQERTKARHARANSYRRTRHCTLTFAGCSEEC